MPIYPKGEKFYLTVSPNGKYILDAYFINGGSLNGDAVRVEMLRKSNDKPRNIYYCYPKNDVTIEWIDNENVKINDVKINILKDRYECD